MVEPRTTKYDLTVRFSGTIDHEVKTSVEASLNRDGSSDVRIYFIPVLSLPTGIYAVRFSGEGARQIALEPIVIVMHDSLPLFMLEFPFQQSVRIHYYTALEERVAE